MLGFSGKQGVKGNAKTRYPSPFDHQMSLSIKVRVNVGIQTIVYIFKACCSIVEAPIPFKSRHLSLRCI
jgi:hypothetical protein